MEYTAIGDTVNLASRLESATKEMGVGILISEYTHNALRGSFRFRNMGSVQVKGRAEPVLTYSVEEPEPKRQFVFQVVRPDSTVETYRIGPHTPTMKTEDVHLVHIERRIQYVIRLHLGARVHPGNERCLAGQQVKVNLTTHRLDHVNTGAHRHQVLRAFVFVKHTLGEAGIVNILRPQAERDCFLLGR